MSFLFFAALLGAQSLTNSEIENEALSKMSMLSYRVCLTNKAADYASTSERLETAVDAAFGACFEDRSRLFSHLKQSRTSLTDAEVEGQIEWVDQMERKRLLGFVLELRSNR